MRKFMIYAHQLRKIDCLTYFAMTEVLFYYEGIEK